MISVFDPAAHAQATFRGPPRSQFSLSSLNTSVGITAVHLYHSNCIAAQRIKQDDEMAPLIFTRVKGVQRGVYPACFISDIENGSSNLPCSVPLGIPLAVRAENIAGSPMTVQEGVPSEGKWLQRLRSNKDL